MDRLNLVLCATYNQLVFWKPSKIPQYPSHSIFWNIPMYAIIS